MLKEMKAHQPKKINSTLKADRANRMKDKTEKDLVLDRFKDYVVELYSQEGKYFVDEKKASEISCYHQNMGDEDGFVNCFNSVQDNFKEKLEKDLYISLSFTVKEMSACVHYHGFKYPDNKVEFDKCYEKYTKIYRNKIRSYKGKFFFNPVSEETKIPDVLEMD